MYKHIYIYIHTNNIYIYIYLFIYLYKYIQANMYISSIHIHKLHHISLIKRQDTCHIPGDQTLRPLWRARSPPAAEQSPSRPCPWRQGGKSPEGLELKASRIASWGAWKTSKYIVCINIDIDIDIDIYHYISKCQCMYTYIYISIYIYMFQWCLWGNLQS